MSEDFVRCTNCGNLNIKGTTKCVFCDAEIDSDAEIFKEHADDPSVSELPAVPATPSISEEPSSEYPALPAMPDIPSVEIEEAIKTEKACDPADLKEYSSGLKFTFLSLIFLAISVLHYLLNILVALAAFRPENPNIELSLAIPDNIASLVLIEGSSIILGIPFTIIVGYLIGKSIRRFTSSKKAIISWLIYAIFLDLAINVGIAIIAIYAFNVVDLYFLYLVGSVFVFIIFNLFTLFLPLLIGSNLIFCNIDKIFFPKRYSGI